VRASVLEAFEISQQAEQLKAAGNLREAIAAAERSVQIARRDGAARTNPWHFVVMLNRLAFDYFDNDQWREAETLFKEADVLSTVTREDDPEQPAVCLTGLGLTAWRQGRFDVAKPMLERALAILVKVHGDNHETVATAENNLGLLLRDQGSYPEAERRLKRARDLRVALKSQPSMLAISLMNIAGLMRDQGRFEEARPLAAEALSITTTSRPSSSSELATALNLNAEIERGLGLLDEAEKKLGRALEIRNERFGAESVKSATTLNSLGGVLEAQGSLDKAEEVYRRALQIREKLLPPDHPELARSRANLGALLKSKGDLTAAEDLLRNALQAREAKLGAGHPDTVKSMAQLADLLRQKGDKAGADALFGRVISIRRSAITSQRVLYGTNRVGVPAAAGPAYGGEAAGRMIVGYANVWIESERSRQTAAGVWQNLKRLVATERPSDEEATDVARLHIRNLTESDPPTLTKLARSDMRDAGDFTRQALVFVHGYNVTFENALKRAAQIAYDLRFDGPVFAYSWPSQGNLLSYPADRIQAENARDYLAMFLKEVVAPMGAANVHLISHSMGNKLMLEVLRDAAEHGGLGVTVGEIVFAAPDVEVSQFRMLVSHVPGSGRISTLYASNNDRALLASRVFWQGAPAGYVALSKGPCVVAGVESIDISEAGDNFFGLNHDLFASNPVISADLRTVLRSSVHPPDKRGKIFQASKNGEGAFWVYHRSTN
jgi:esterase/lipase superfamily enzyme/Tfp pilus assembly protein PilF